MGILNKYRIEHKISTLAYCKVMQWQQRPPSPSFVIDEIEFSQWGFNYRDCWTNNAWLAAATIDAENYKIAFIEFQNKLCKLIPRISFVSQCYIEYLSEPFLIQKEASDVAFFRYVEETEPVGLSFAEEEERALSELSSNSEIPDAFYYYWNDAVNSTGYSAKLLLMFSAIESLIKKDGGKVFSLRKEIFGEDLVEDIYAQNTGLRHRLVHGEYFRGPDSDKDYLDIVHKKVIDYFNTKILSKPFISTDMIDPQRHFFGNRNESKSFLKMKDAGHPFDLKSLLQDFNNNEEFNKKYAGVFDDELKNTY